MQKAKSSCQDVDAVVGKVVGVVSVGEGDVAGEAHGGEVVGEPAADPLHQRLQAGQPTRAQLLDVSCQLGRTTI